MSEFPSGFKISDLLTLPDDLRSIVNAAVRRQQISVAQLSDRTGEPAEILQSKIDLLINQGFLEAVESENKVYYIPRLTRTK